MVTQIVTDEIKIRALLASALPSLSYFLVGLIEVIENGDNEDAFLGGSGALVAIDDVFGILTARHVIEHIFKRERAGLVLPSLGGGVIHRTIFSLDQCRRIEFCNDGLEEKFGPDLGLLIPPPNIVSELRARQSFYNITKRQERMLIAPPASELGIWVLSGFAAEWTEERSEGHGSHRAKGFTGQHGVGIIKDEREAAGFDYLTFEALYDDNYEGPQSFGGYSGAALWQLLVKPTEAGLSVSEYVLSGVAFYQSPKIVEDERVTRDIYCHGKKSIFGNLVERVRSLSRLTVA